MKNNKNIHLCSFFCFNLFAHHLKNNFSIFVALTFEMKLFAYLLALVVLVLSIMPCADVPEDHSVQKTELSSTTSDHHHSDEDQCSPFCSCHCCQASFYVSTIAVTFSTEIIEFSYNETPSSFQNLELFDFLIPPKA